MVYQVVVPAVQVKGAGVIYRGMIIPAASDPADVARLVELGFILPVETDIPEPEPEPEPKPEPESESVEDSAEKAGRKPGRPPKG